MNRTARGAHAAVTYSRLPSGQPPPTPSGPGPLRYTTPTRAQRSSHPTAFRVTPLDDALTHDDRQFGRITVHPLMSAARQLLDALARPGAV